MHRVKVLRDSLKQLFIYKEHPQEEQKGDSEDEEDKQTRMQKSGAIFYDSVGQLLEVYLAKKMELEVQVSGVKSVIDKTEE